MTVSVTHATVAVGANDPTKEVSSTAWNESHTVTGLGTAAEAATTDFATAAQGALADTAVQPAGLSSYATTAAVAAGYQPLDADLTAIAALSPSNDDVLQRKAGAWTNRTLAQLLADLSISGSYQPLDTDLTAIAALTSAADKVPYATGAGTWALADFTVAGRNLVDDASADAQLTTLGLTANGKSLVTAADYAAMRALLDLEVGTDFLSPAAIAAAYQPLDSDLTTIAGLTATTDNFIVSVASAWASRTPTQVKTTLGLTVGTDVQAYDAELAAIAGLTSAADRLPYFTGSGTAALATFTAAGRALVDDADAAAQLVTLGAIGNSLLTTRGDIITRGASAPQRLALGTTGYYLKSDGTDAVWAAVSSGSLVFISEQTAANVTSIDFTSGIDSTYSEYEIHIQGLTPITEGQLRLLTSTDGGSSFDTGASDYQYVYNYMVAGSATASTLQSSGAAQIVLAQATTSGIGNAAGEPGLSGVIRIFQPSNAEYCMMRIDLVQVDPSANLRHLTGGAMRKSAADVNAVRFIMASGNIDTGHFALYGVAD